jgi:Sec-independent protein translocase protein TatA
MAGVGQQLISQIETGANTTTKKLPEIARSLGCAIHELDPNYGNHLSAGDPIMEKFSRILAENDEDQLQQLDSYLDFLLSRQQKHDDSNR